MEVSVDLDTGGPLILVADDDPDTAELVSFKLARAGYRTAIAQDGLRALKSIATEKPDLVLLDIDMPHLDGKAVAKIIKSAGNGDAPAVIFLTAHGSVSDRVEGLDLGAVDYVVKPFSTPELLARIEVALRLRRRERASA